MSEIQYLNFYESVEESKSVGIDMLDDGTYEISWIRRNGTFDVRTTVKLTKEAAIATHKLLGEYIVQERIFDLIEKYKDESKNMENDQ